MQAEIASIHAQIRLLFPDPERRFRGLGWDQLDRWAPDAIRPDELEDYFPPFQGQETRVDAAVTAILNEVLLEMKAVEELLRGESLDHIGETIAEIRDALDDVLDGEDPLEVFEFVEYDSALALWEQLAVRTRFWGDSVGLVTIPKVFGARPFVRTQLIADYVAETTSELACVAQNLRRADVAVTRWRIAALVLSTLLLLTLAARYAG